MLHYLTELGRYIPKDTSDVGNDRSVPNSRIVLCSNHGSVLTEPGSEHFELSLTSSFREDIGIPSPVMPRARFDEWPHIPHRLGTEIETISGRNAILIETVVGAIQASTDLLNPQNLK
jgi:hypothetical protein